MEEIWIISRTVFYSHQFYRDFLHQDFLARPRNFPTMKTVPFGYEAAAFSAAEFS